LRHTVVYGGVSQKPQAQALHQGVDILVATPGRLLDLVSQRLVDLSAVETFVLDEADRMLDMGFLPEIRRIIDELPKVRQTLFFSATMPEDIQRLSGSILRDPVRVAAGPASSPRRTSNTGLLRGKAKQGELLRHLLSDGSIKTRWSSRGRSTGPTGSPGSFPALTSAPSRSTATSPRLRANAPWPTSSAARRGCWWPPTSPRAGWTSWTSPT
jgi:superfamily II DNA/RNA helicase